MKNDIANVALAFAISCFILYVVVTVVPLFAKPNVGGEGGAERHERETLIGMGVVTDAVNAMVALAEALAKAGPGLSALIGSILFLLIAAMASGLFGP